MPARSLHYVCFSAKIRIEADSVVSFEGDVDLDVGIDA